MGAHVIHRRAFLASALGTALTPFARTAAEDKTSSCSFFVVSDTHYLANKENPAQMNASSAEICGRLIDTLNRLPGNSLPDVLGGGKVIAPLGVIHGGDIIDSGDKAGRVFDEMQRTEFAAYEKDYGLAGGDGKLKYPIYEVYGNHDSPRSNGHAIDRLRDRNKSRKGLTSLSENGLHFSWNMGPLHFINLGITVGSGKGSTPRRRYNPAESLEFLKADLKRNAVEENRPVIVTHHVDTQRYLKMTEEVKGVEWDPEDVKLFGEAMAPYNIAMVFYGHTHRRVMWKWGVQNGDVSKGIDVFNADNSSHFQDDNQAFLYVEISGSSLVIRECITRDRWTTFDWSPQAWRKEMTLAVGK